MSFISPVCWVCHKSTDLSKGYEVVKHTCKRSLLKRVANWPAFQRHSQFFLQCTSCQQYHPHQHTICRFSSSPKSVHYKLRRKCSVGRSSQVDWFTIPSTFYSHVFRSCKTERSIPHFLFFFGTGSSLIGLLSDHPLLMLKASAGTTNLSQMSETGADCLSYCPYTTMGYGFTCWCS